MGEFITSWSRELPSSAVRWDLFLFFLYFFFLFFFLQMDFKNDTTSKAIHSIFRNAIKLLQEEGLVFQKDGGFDNLFYVRDLQLNFFS